MVCSALEMRLEGRTEGERLVGLLGVDGWVWMDETRGGGKEREGESLLLHTHVVHMFFALLVEVLNIWS